MEFHRAGKFRAHAHFLASHLRCQVRFSDSWNQLFPLCRGLDVCWQLPGQNANGQVLGWLALVAIVLGVPALFLVSFRLKAVWLDGDELVVANYLSTERIPLENVIDVHCWPFLNPNLVKLRFASPSRFGTSIMFIGPGGLVCWPFREHALITWFRAKVEEVREHAHPSRK